MKMEKCPHTGSNATHALQSIQNRVFSSFACKVIRLSSVCRASYVGNEHIELHFMYTAYVGLSQINTGENSSSRGGIDLCVI